MRGGPRICADLHHRAVGADGRRADLHEEVAGDRHPGRVAPGEDLQADVAERVDEEHGGGLGVRRGVERTAPLAAEHELVADHGVAVVRDRLADDGDVGGIGEDDHLSPDGRQLRPIVERPIHNSAGDG